MINSQLPRKTRTFLLWTARLALVAFMMQIAAVGHWHSDLGGVAGVEGSSIHIDHCHGGGDCSSGAGASVAINTAPPHLPLPSTITTFAKESGDRSPTSAFIETVSEPPQTV